MYISVEEKKSIISAAIRTVIGEGICDYLGIAEKLNDRRIKMLKGGKWSTVTARNYCVGESLNYERDKILSARRKVIDDAIAYEIERDGTQTVESMTYNLNARKILTIKGFEWTEKNLQSWINASNRSRKAFDENTMSFSLKQSIGTLKMMVKTNELERSGSWGDCMERAHKTVENLRHVNSSKLKKQL